MQPCTHRWAHLGTAVSPFKKQILQLKVALSNLGFIIYLCFLSLDQLTASHAARGGGEDAFIPIQFIYSQWP